MLKEVEMLVSKEGLPFNGKPSKIFITSIEYGTPTSLPKVNSVEDNAHVESGRSKKDTIEEVRAFQQLVPVFEPRPKPNIPTTWEEFFDSTPSRPNYIQPSQTNDSSLYD